MESCASQNVAKLARLTWVKTGRFMTAKANVDFAPFAMPLPFPSLKDADTARMELTPVLPLVIKANNCVELVVKLVVLLRIWFRNKDSSKLNCRNFFRLETNSQNQSQSQISSVQCVIR